MLKRSYRKVVIMLYVVSFVILFIAYFSNGDNWLHGSSGFVIAMIFQGVALFFKNKYLRCPYCGKEYAPLQWSKSGIKYCEKCGKPFEYDK